LRATVALCRLAALAHHAYQHREEISAVARQFMDDIQNNAHHDPEWLAQNGYIFTHVLSDVFVSPQIGNKLMNTSSMRPLANGLKRQTEAVQACIRNGVNAAGQKACDGLKNILQNAGEALKTGNPQPAFAGMQNNASVRTSPENLSQGAVTAAQDSLKNLADKIRKIDKNVLDEMESAGGHTLKLHVGQTNQELIKRAMSSKIGAATSFYDKKTAINAIQTNLRNNANQIAEWINDSHADRKKAFEFNHGYEIGSGVFGGKKNGVSHSNISRVALQKESKNSLGFIVLTAFPAMD